MKTKQDSVYNIGEEHAARQQTTLFIGSVLSVRTTYNVFLVVYVSMIRYEI